MDTQGYCNDTLIRQMIEGFDRPWASIIINHEFSYRLRDNKRIDAFECAADFSRSIHGVDKDNSLVDHAISKLKESLEASNDDCDCNKEEKTNSKPDHAASDRVKELEKAIKDYLRYCDQDKIWDMMDGWSEQHFSSIEFDFEHRFGDVDVKPSECASFISS